MARRSIDWLHDNGCRVLALMGGEPLLRPDFVHKVVYYAAKKGFWVYIATNGRSLRPEVADRLGDAGVSVFNFALDSWDLKPSLPKAFVPAQKNLEHILRKQYVDGYIVFFNMNICCNNTDDIRKLTEYARDHPRELHPGTSRRATNRTLSLYPCASDAKAHGQISVRRQSVD